MMFTPIVLKLRHVTTTKVEKRCHKYWDLIHTDRLFCVSFIGGTLLDQLYWEAVR